MENSGHMVGGERPHYALFPLLLYSDLTLFACYFFVFLIRHCVSYFADPELCNFDVLKIVDGSRTFSYCGRGTPPDYTSSGNKISLAFKSDSSLELNGFNISFSTFNVEPSGSK